MSRAGNIVPSKTLLDLLCGNPGLGPLDSIIFNRSSIRTASRFGGDLMACVILINLLPVTYETPRTVARTCVS